MVAVYFAGSQNEVWGANSWSCYASQPSCCPCLW